MQVSSRQIRDNRCNFIDLNEVKGLAVFPGCRISYEADADPTLFRYFVLDQRENELTSFIDIGFDVSVS
ncbi:hypothetical protein RB195_004535 [Necator americanus]|uniref:Uncharacterized protein n=1 Tax=Necator americanus TaxID=51031 RepID=A0ABR1BM46_NECAM